MSKCGGKVLQVCKVILDYNVNTLSMLVFRADLAQPILYGVISECRWENHMLECFPLCKNKFSLHSKIIMSEKSVGWNFSPYHEPFHGKGHLLWYGAVFSYADHQHPIWKWYNTPRGIGLSEIFVWCWTNSKMATTEAWLTSSSFYCNACSSPSSIWSARKSLRFRCWLKLVDFNVGGNIQIFICTTMICNSASHFHFCFLWFGVMQLTLTISQHRASSRAQARVPSPNATPWTSR